MPHLLSQGLHASTTPHSRAYAPRAQAHAHAGVGANAHNHKHTNTNTNTHYTHIYTTFTPDGEGVRGGIRGPSPGALPPPNPRGVISLSIPPPSQNSLPALIWFCSFSQSRFLLPGLFAHSAEWVAIVNRMYRSGAHTRARACVRAHACRRRSAAGGHRRTTCCRSCLACSRDCDPAGLLA